MQQALHFVSRVFLCLVVVVVVVVVVFFGFFYRLWYRDTCMHAKYPDECERKTGIGVVHRLVVIASGVLHRSLCVCSAWRSTFVLFRHGCVTVRWVSHDPIF